MSTNSTDGLPKITLSKRDAHERFVAVQKNLKRMGHHIKQLVRHPKTTQEEMIPAQVAYQSCWNSYQTARAILRAKWPDSRNDICVWAWNKEDDDL